MIFLKLDLCFIIIYNISVIVASRSKHPRHKQISVLKLYDVRIQLNIRFICKCIFCFILLFQWTTTCMHNKTFVQYTDFVNLGIAIAIHWAGTNLIATDLNPHFWVMFVLFFYMLIIQRKFKKWWSTKFHLHIIMNTKN